MASVNITQDICDLCGDRLSNAKTSAVMVTDPFTQESSIWTMHAQRCPEVVAESAKSNVRRSRSGFSLAEHIVNARLIRPVRNTILALHCELSHEFINAAPVMKAGEKLEEALSGLQCELDNEHCSVTTRSLTPPFVYYGTEKLDCKSRTELFAEIDRRLQIVCKRIVARYGAQDELVLLAMDSLWHLNSWLTSYENASGLRKNALHKITEIRAVTRRSGFEDLASMRQLDLDRILSKHPRLNIAGFGVGQGKQSLAELRVELSSLSNLCNQICNWLLVNATPTKSIKNNRTSYGWKHVVEREIGRYVPNGAFIAAAIHLGYRYEIASPGSLNAFFNLVRRKRSAG